MIRRIKSKLNRTDGLTLVEIVLVMLISATVFTGMMVTYSEGVRYTRENSSTMTLYNEGKAAMELIGTKIRHAGRVRVFPYAGTSNAKLQLDYVGDLGGGNIEFIFQKSSKRLRWNDRTNRQSRLNMTLLPFLDFNIGPYEEPYLKVKHMEFIPMDHIGPPSPYLEGYSMIRVEMVLEDDHGDTLYMSSIHSKRNNL